MEGMKKGETFQKEKKRKGKERKHFGRRNGKKRSRNISEGETERKGKERKGNILQRRRKERRIRKEEKACGGSRSDVAGDGEVSFCYSRGPAYRGIIGGIACRVRVNG